MKTKLIARWLLTSLVISISLCASTPPAWAQLAGKKVVISPGHGGSDPGALGVDGPGYPNEEDFNLEEGLLLRTMLQNAGCTVAMTRTTDTTVSMSACRDFINAQNPNCAISIMHNSFSDSSANGTETFWHTSGNASDQLIAQKVQNRLLQYLGRFNRGVKQGSFSVTAANPPVCMAENLFLSNPTEFNIINGPSGRQNAATAFYMAVGDFLGIPLDQVNNASVVSVSHPATVNAGQVFSATITMNNNGSKPWTTDGTPHRLGSQNPQDNTLWGTTRIGLPFAPVNAGQNASFTYNFTAPTTPGTYAFDWRMVEDGVQWFGATAARTINVVNPPSLVTVTVDNSDPGFSAPGTWSTGTSSTDKFGTDYRFRPTAPVSEPAQWVGALSNVGTYWVYAWWTQGANRSTTAPYIVYHASGSTTVNKNQQTGGGAWQSLGSFSLVSGNNTVKLSCWTSTGFIVLADAVKWAQQ